MKKLVILSIVALSLIGIQKIDAQVAVSAQIEVAPPEIPEYVQPACPTDGYLWTPGYWAYGAFGYYWVPGVWISPPTVGYLWTPGYWGCNNGIYAWNGGYWGSNIGFYGGVNYGYGYGGRGFYGGRWEGGAFRYNSAVWSVNSSFHNTYSDRTGINSGGSRSSFNGKGGVTAEPNAAEQSAMKEKHMQPTSAQQSHEHSASNSKSQRASVNGGHPSVAAKSTVGGQRFNSSGHTMAAPAHTSHTVAAPTHSGVAHSTAAPQHQAAQQHAAAQHTAPVQHQAQHAAPVHHSTPVQHQAQHAAPAQHQSQPMQQHAAPAQHSAPVQHAAPAQRQSQPMQQHSAPAAHEGGGEKR